VLLGAAACTADLPTSAAIDEMDVEQVESQAKQAGMLVPLVDDDNPLFIVDGVIVDGAEARGLEPEQIRKIEVLRTRAALKEYGERGEHGVILVETLAQGEPRVLGTPIEERVAGGEIRLRRTDRRMATLRESRVGISELGSGADSPLIVVDGVIAAASFSLRGMSPESIEKIEVIKGKAARVLYDNARAANGVILITTRPGGR
jgi:outer membrane receptor protein involved in Fe transport